MQRATWRWLSVLVLAALVGSIGGPAPAPAASAAAPEQAAVQTQAPLPGGSNMPPRPDRPVARVKIGMIGTISDVTFYAAEEKGWFDWMRIEPEYERFDSGGRMISALATNQVEVGIGAPSVGLYNAIGRGVDVRMVADRASGTSDRDAWVFFARRPLLDSGALRDWSDLRGRKIGLAARGIAAEALLARGLERGGLTLADVEIVELSYPDQIVALETGAIELAVAPEPYPTLAAQRGVGDRWRGSQDVVDSHIASTMMYTGQFISQRPDVARDFMVAFLLGVRFYNDAFIRGDAQTLAEAQEMTQRRLGLSDPTLLQRFRPSAMNPNGALDRAALAADYQWFRQQGGLTAEVSMDRVVDNSFADYAVSVLGPYR